MNSKNVLGDIVTGVWVAFVGLASVVVGIWLVVYGVVCVLVKMIRGKR